jgi:hypothetical protein
MMSTGGVQVGSKEQRCCRLERAKDCFVEEQWALYQAYVTIYKCYFSSSFLVFTNLT